jgi:mannitol-1-phosphate 5-dehydrogenase
MNLKPFSPFHFYIKQKLFIHNLGHAACAYMGSIKGYKYIWQAVGDKTIKNAAKQAMTESAAALSRHYAVPIKDILSHIEDLLARFANKALSDSAARVGRDPLRKLSPHDRMAGAAHFCKGENLPYGAILEVVAAALLFWGDDDESARKMHDMISESSRAGFLQSWSKLSADDAERAAELARQMDN